MGGVAGSAGADSCHIAYVSLSLYIYIYIYKHIYIVPLSGKRRSGLSAKCPQCLPPWCAPLGACKTLRLWGTRGDEY